jgi:hypothetical protein
MKATITTTAFGLAVTLAAGRAAAQTPEPARLRVSPARPAVWDVSTQVGWLGGHKPGVGEPWDDWYSNGVFTASIGRYWTAHIRTEIEASFSNEGEIYGHDEIRLPGAPFPIFRSREHHFRNRTASSAVLYQFAENALFHPFLGGGVDLNWERQQVEFPEAFAPTRDPRVPMILPALPSEIETAFTARPFLMAGFKTYFNERGFFRSDIKTSIDDGRVAHVVWRAGFGVDF